MQAHNSRCIFKHRGFSFGIEQFWMVQHQDRNTHVQNAISLVFQIFLLSRSQHSPFGVAIPSITSITSPQLLSVHRKLHTTYVTLPHFLRCFVSSDATTITPTYTSTLVKTSKVYCRDKRQPGKCVPADQ